MSDVQEGAICLPKLLQLMRDTLSEILPHLPRDQAADLKASALQLEGVLIDLVMSIKLFAEKCVRLAKFATQYITDDDDDTSSFWRLWQWITSWWRPVEDPYNRFKREFKKLYETCESSFDQLSCKLNEFQQMVDSFKQPGLASRLQFQLGMMLAGLGDPRILRAAVAAIIPVAVVASVGITGILVFILIDYACSSRDRDVLMVMRKCVNSLKIQLKECKNYADLANEQLQLSLGRNERPDQQFREWVEKLSHNAKKLLDEVEQVVALVRKRNSY